VRTVGEVYASNTSIAWVDRNGQTLETVAPLAAYQGPQLSPDGRFLAVETFDNRNPGDIWIHDTVRHVGMRLTRDDGRDSDPIWSPTGDRIAWIHDGGGERHAIVIQRADGAEEGTLLPADPRLRQLGWSGPYTSDWSPDGRYLSVTRLFGPEGAMIEFLTVDGRAGVSWPAAKWAEGGARFSPNGRYVAYKSNETGHGEIYVRSFPPGPGRTRVSNNGGIDPAWRGDGREIYYLSPDRTLMAAAVHATGSTIEIGQPAPLFAAPVPDPNWLRNTYVPSKDGRRFLLLVLDRTVPPPAADVIVVTNAVQAIYDELARERKAR
jgi:Tol biopolymer transport system component